MKRKVNIFNKNTILLIFCILIYFVLLFLIYNRSLVNLNVYKGVLSSLQFGVCLIMMYASKKYGARIAIVLLIGYSLSLFCRFFRGSYDALPGVFNSIFYVITAVIIARYNYKRDVENKTDIITGTFNRRGFYREVKEKINNNEEFFIVNINLNNFKTINDTYGHAFGDELLRKLSLRIKKKLGSKGTVARVGGAEFIVAIEENKNIQVIADRLLDSIREKSILIVDDNKVECYVECYAGVSCFPTHAKDYESLLKYADIAMTEAMSTKSKQTCLFDAAMLEKINRQVQLKNFIKEGLAKDYFYLVYQPQYEVNSKKLRGFETLLRMKTADGKIVSPAEFIPVAEKSDLIFQIDDYVLVRAMKEFKDVVLNNPELTVSVNVSAKNFADVDFVKKIEKMLADTEFPAKNFEIEITEYCVVNSMEITTQNIIALRNNGVQIALDDFGTGYTSLNYVASLPIDLLKIDKSLIDNIETAEKRRDFVRTVISMGRLMNCEVISEGVENDSQIACLKEDGCDYVQGFVWGKPLMYEDAVQLANS